MPQPPQTALPNVNVTAFKVLLQRHKESVYHRFRGVYSFAEFQSVVGHLWGTAPRCLQCEYQDDEGDRIRLTSENEWAECLTLWHRMQIQGEKETPLRVFVRRVKKEKKEARKKDGSQQDTSIITQDDDEENSEAEQPSPAEKQQPTCAVPPLELSSRPRTTPTVCCETPEHSQILELLSAIFKTNAAQALFDGSIPDTMGLLRRSPSASSAQEVDIDIDQRVLYELMVKVSNGAMDDQDYDFAEKVLRAGLLAFPNDILCEYNLACVLSLQGKVEEALEVLGWALRDGYTNVEFIRNDEDLRRVRADSRFEEVLRKAGFSASIVSDPPAALATAPAEEPATKLESQPQPELLGDIVSSTFASTESLPFEPVVAEPPAPVETESQPAPLSVPQPPTPLEQKAEAEPKLSASIPPKVRTLMSVFPALTVEEATNALQRAGGNVAVAVNRLLL